MDAIIQLMQSVTGRVIRIIIGLILLALGLLVMQGGLWGIIVAIIGLIPIVAALSGVIFVAPLFGYTLTGHKRAGPASS
jgi:hypothetical protein